MTAPRRMLVGLLAAGTVAIGLADEPRRNVFGDPFAQATNAVAACPVPPGPLLTEAEARAQAHARIERGTSCWRSGRCRLPNAYLYDREIVPRVVQSIRQDARFQASSIWVTGQRRWVTQAASRRARSPTRWCTRCG